MIEEFHRPRTVREALSLKRKLRERAAFLAGGTLLNSKDSPMHPRHAISLAGLGLDRIGKKDGEIVIGALCTLQQLIEDRKVPESLKTAVSQVVSRNIRNMATIGGHIAANQPHSDVLPMLLALEAKVRLSGSGAARMVSVGDYILAGDDSLITAIVIPRAQAKRVAACCTVRGSASARSILSAAVSVVPGRSGLQNPIIALGGVVRHVARVIPAEMALEGKPAPAPEDLAHIVSQCARPASTPFESAAYRRDQAGVVVAQAFAKALHGQGGRG
jgi:putative selenate reductase FAD-binding subunit